MGKEAFDNYPTPTELAFAITQFCHSLFPQKQIIIEPSCGQGNFLHAARQLWPGASPLGIDLVGDYRIAVENLGVPFVQGDFTQYAPQLGNAWLNENTLVITNPPYSNDLPQRFVEVVSQNAAPGCHIALLLRQAFLGGINRAVAFKERSSLKWKRDIAGRPKFNPNDKAQDHSEYAVFIYEVGYSGHYTGWKHPLLWKPTHLKKYAAQLEAAK